MAGDRAKSQFRWREVGDDEWSRPVVASSPSGAARLAADDFEGDACLDIEVPCPDSMIVRFSVSVEWEPRYEVDQEGQPYACPVDDMPPAPEDPNQMRLIP
jgi:hypothetical protein